MVVDIGQRRDAREHGVQGARQPRHRTGDDKREQLEGAHVVADGERTFFVVANGQQRAAKHRFRHTLHEEEHDEEQRRDKRVERPR
ncbi:hypothetical+protein [Escherichia coli]|nr:hypothetical+protein [Escherichia coli]